MSKNNKSMNIIKEFVKQRLLLENIYQPINFYEDVYEIAINKPSMNREDLVQKILNLKNEILPKIKNKKERKKTILDFTKSIRDTSGFDIRNLTIYLKPILSFMKASGDTNLEECLRVANLFNNKLLKKVNEDFRQKVMSGTLSFDNIVNLTYYYEENILPTTKKAKGNMTLDEMKEKFRKDIIIDNENYLAIHPKNSFDFAEVVKVLVKDLDDPDYPAVSWCTQNPGSWSEHNSSEHIIILYNKKLHYSDRDKTINIPLFPRSKDDSKDLKDSEIDYKAPLYKYSLISLKVYKNDEGFYDDDDEDVFEEIAYESSVNIDNDHSITKQGLKAVIPNFKKFNDTIIKYCQKVSSEEEDEEIKKIDPTEVVESLHFFSDHNMFDKAFKFFEVDIQKRSPIQALSEYAKQIISYAILNSSKKEFCFKLITELFINITYRKAIRKEYMKWLSKDFRECVEKSPDLADFFFDYCSEEIQKDNRGIYAYSLLYYFGTNYDNNKKSPSGFDKSKIAPVYKSIINKLKTGSLSEALYLNFLVHYEIHSSKNFDNCFYFIDDLSINKEVFETHILNYLNIVYKNSDIETCYKNLIENFESGKGFYLLYFANDLSGMFSQESLNNISNTLSSISEKQYQELKNKYYKKIQENSISNVGKYSNEDYLDNAFEKLKNISGKTKSIDGIEYKEEDIPF